MCGSYSEYFDFRPQVMEQPLVDAAALARWLGYSALFLVIGLGLWAFYRNQTFATPDEIFPKFIVEVMPPGLTGLVIAAILMSGLWKPGVSFDVAARRCEDLGLLPQGAGYAISQQLKKEFGSPEKRAEYLELPPRQRVVLPPVSAHLAKAISQSIRRGDASIGWVTDRLGLSIGEVLAINAESSSS